MITVARSSGRQDAEMLLVFIAAARGEFGSSITPEGVKCIMEDTDRIFFVCVM